MLTINYGGELYHVFLDGLPHIMTEQGFERLGYWEDRLEIALWACSVYHIDAYTSEFVWPTGECTDVYDLIDEHCDAYQL